MVIKTREKLIEVARQLFAHKGVENTTMNDIAAASEKGRRTIYTYFKNKREIYNAVIERESEQLVQTLREVAESNSPAIEKVGEFINRRLGTIAPAGSRHDVIRSFFMRDFRRIERIRRAVAAKNREIFEQILREGVERGEFDANQARLLPSLVNILFQGMDYCLIKGSVDDAAKLESMKQGLTQYIVAGLKSHATTTENISQS